MSGKECNSYRCKKLLILGHVINIGVYDTGAGINILIEGGEKGHIGAVAIALSGRVIESIVFPFHKENVICEKWAVKLSMVYNGPVIVEAGVHYDNITREQIQEILEVLDKELNSLVKDIQGRKIVNNVGGNL